MNLEQLTTLLSGAFLLWLGIALNTLQEKRRWLREWNIGMVKEWRSFSAEVCAAMDRQYLIHGLIHNANRSGGPIADDRIRAADEAWRTVLAQRVIYGTHELQNAMTKFDQIRAESTLAINARNVREFDEIASRLRGARGARCYADDDQRG
ncbi:hypothetical protein ACFVWG_33470 [Kribbella sp. NPDC058245]|uniref:hypothetical protein n=1 Tax=Kribbella sp. NPDC058245 TaxID=3346399 RepID=UPI0036E8A899